MSKLVDSIQGLQGRALTSDEIQKLQSFQRLYQVDDDDPILVVLAMMANSQLILEAAPSLLQAEVAKTIEHHRTNMRDQAVLISKDLIGVISQQINAANESKKGKDFNKSQQWEMLIACFVGGVAFTGLVLFLLKHFSQ